MVPHASQHDCFVQRTHDKNCVVQFGWIGRNQMVRRTHWFVVALVQNCFLCTAAFRNRTFKNWFWVIKSVRFTFPRLQFCAKTLNIQFWRKFRQYFLWLVARWSGPDIQIRPPVSCNSRWHCVRFAPKFRPNVSLRIVLKSSISIALTHMTFNHVLCIWCLSAELGAQSKTRKSRTLVPFDSGLAIITLTPGKSFPLSIRQRLWGLPLSTKLTLSFRSALRSTYTVDGSGLEAPCRQIATFTLQPNEVETALGLKPANKQLFFFVLKMLVNVTELFEEKCVLQIVRTAKEGIKEENRRRQCA